MTPDRPAPNRPAPDRPAADRPDLVIRARRVVTPGGVIPAEVRITDGTITAVTSYAVLAARQKSAADEPAVLHLADDEVLMPGLVDTHVHVNEPGRTHWEGFATATAAAAAGGVTTIVDMPLNSLPPVTTVAALEAKRRAAAGQCAVDVGFWGGAVPGNEGDRPGLHEAGVLGFKCFLADSGVPEFPPLRQEELGRALEWAATTGALFVMHAEDAAVLASAPAPSGRDYAGFLASRPPQAEIAAVARLAALARATGARVHVLHLSAAGALPLIAAARADGARITAETCPHYLALAAEQIGTGRTECKCCPPVREAANRELLWAGLADGVIGCVVSDHSPCPPELKRAGGGDFGAAWGGIASVQLGLAVTWTHARRRGFGLADVARWTASAPAGLAGLARKGAIAAGKDADLVAFAPDEPFVVDPGTLLTRHPLTAYAGAELTGVVRGTWLRGSRVRAGRPAGRLLAAHGRS